MLALFFTTSTALAKCKFVTACLCASNGPRGNSFFQMSSYARANVRITNAENKRQIPMRASRGLKWENKTYKLKRSISSTHKQFS